MPQPSPPVAAIVLTPKHASALAVLLPLLGCGEEAAALAFDDLSAATADAAAAAMLTTIAAEERVHDALIARLIEALPPAPGAAAARRAARRFHINIGRGDTTLRLARIAATDAAVCTILSRLLRAGRPLATDPVAGGILARIHRDEARHVRLSRSLAAAVGEPKSLRDVGAATRAALADVLRLGATAFYALEVDPDRLDRDLRMLPDGMFPR